MHRHLARSRVLAHGNAENGIWVFYSLSIRFSSATFDVHKYNSQITTVALFYPTRICTPTGSCNILLTDRQEFQHTVESSRGPDRRHYLLPDAVFLLLFV
jgi:hypothetical protein